MKDYLIIFLLLAGGMSGLSTQKAPIKFGKVRPEMVAESFYEPDSTVDAVVLC